ncbi:MAG: hypothetical protein K8F92_16685 [Hyphomicrobium sp.]|uniref:hypothetical protein n=1 Tax=Hyphomicrobium sp. TaxID=82 RepID=UPI001320FA09|nr:hypothetical protein [Hyphomicrobium sp.]KAB2938278.1 MAG: hypothetical protein F9K20_19035 [Hyphomicrobium sp.]MBZ0211269.1 hypothetical protein [Hyphomicrobium sp.]
MDGQSSPQPAEARQVPTLPLDDVMQRFSEAGIGRSRRSLIRYCQSGLLDGTKADTETGPTWFVTEASVERAIQQLSDMIALTDAARHGGHELAEARHDGVHILAPPHHDEARHGPPVADAGVVAEAVIPDATEPAVARRSTPEHDIYEHPYVKRLEDRVEKLEAKYEAQVRRTEEIQLKGQAQLLELQRMTAVGQSQTLADFMLKAKDWMLGRGSEAEQRGPEDAPSS